MTIVLIAVLTLSLVVATIQFFAWAHKYGDEWNWDKVKEGYKKGWLNLLIVTLLLFVATAIVWYVLPEPKSAFGAFAKMWGLWVPIWGVVSGCQILRSLYKIFRETRRAPKPWIAFVAFGLLLLIGATVWYCFEIGKLF